MEERIEKIILNYGIFCREMCCALTFGDNSHANSARNSLDQIYGLMPEEEFKRSFPNAYEVIENARLRWNNHIKSPSLME